jgi:hypothetical protein
MTTADGNKLYAKSGDLESYIEQTDGTLKSVVKKGDVISSINQSEEEVSIDAKHINLNGVVTANQYFQIKKDGSVATKNLTIGGAVFQPFVAAEDSDAEPVRIAGKYYDDYLDSAVYPDYTDEDAQDKGYKGMRPYYTEEQIRRSKLDPEDEDYLELDLPSYATWFTDYSTPKLRYTSYGKDNYLFYAPETYGIVQAYKVKSQFQLDVTQNVVVLPIDDKYVGCHVTLFNSLFYKTSAAEMWATPVIVENGYFASSDQSLQYGEMEFRGGTVELMLVKTKDSTLWQGGQKLWMVVNSNCRELNYYKQVTV